MANRFQTAAPPCRALPTTRTFQHSKEVQWYSSVEHARGTVLLVLVLVVRPFGVHLTSLVVLLPPPTGSGSLGRLGTGLSSGALGSGGRSLGLAFTLGSGSVGLLGLLGLVGLLDLVGAGLGGALADGTSLGLCRHELGKVGFGGGVLDPSRSRASNSASIDQSDANAQREGSGVELHDGCENDLSK